MKTTVNFSKFTDAFRNAGRKDQFSYEGLKALYEYLEQYEEDSQEEIELDVIALCCEYSEDTIQYHLDNYNLETLQELEDHTTVIYVDDLDSPREYDKEKDGDKLIIIQNY